jgi:CO dehydrogenase maturation factor
MAGKGGTGKTTFASLAIRELVKKGTVLAVDADPNTNLNEALGVKVDSTMADAISRIKNDLAPAPSGMTKDQYMEMQIFDSLIEGEDFDLLVMGGPEGAGCYCYANSILRMFMEKLYNNYRFLVADNEAGLEHLSRRTTQNVDHLFVVSDSSARGVRSATRVRELTEAISLSVKHLYLVISRAVPGAEEALAGEVARTGLRLIGTIPDDPLVTEYDLKGIPLVELPDDSPAVRAVRAILEKAGVL